MNMENTLNLTLSNQYFYFALILFLNIMSSCIGTLKTIYVAKQAGKVTYIIIFFDAIIYSFVLKSFSSNGFGAILAYVFGKLIGAFVADKIEKKFAIGINEVDLYVGSPEKMMELQEGLLQHGYSTTANVGLINGLTPRYSLNVQVSRKGMPDFLKLLKEFNVKNPTMTIRELKKVSGKIAERI